MSQPGQIDHQIPVNPVVDAEKSSLSSHFVRHNYVTTKQWIREKTSFQRVEKEVTARNPSVEVRHIGIHRYIECITVAGKHDGLNARD